MDHELLFALTEPWFSATEAAARDLGFAVRHAECLSSDAPGVKVLAVYVPTAMAAYRLAQRTVARLAEAGHSIAELADQPLTPRSDPPRHGHH